jgi:hypothetical protein
MPSARIYTHTIKHTHTYIHTHTHTHTGMQEASNSPAAIMFPKQE